MPKKTLNRLKFYLTLFLALPLPGSAFAQANFGELFGAIIKQGIEQEQRNRMLQHQQQLAAEAQQSWARLDAPVRACFVRAVERRGTSVAALVSQGIMPEDPRVLTPQVREGCQQLATASLARNVTCRVPTETGGSVETKCNERLARREANGTATEISQEEAISIVLAGGPLMRTQVETDGARSARLEAAAAARNRELLQKLQGTIRPYVTSSLDRVRVKAVALNDRIARSIRSSQSGAEEVDRMSAEADALVAFEKAEDARVAALEAAGERYVETTGVSATEANAAAEAYYQAVMRELAKLAGFQSEGKIGKDFRRKLDVDFDGFRSRYFTPDTDHVCEAKARRVSCRVEGAIKLLALRMDFEQSMLEEHGLASQNFTFLVSASDQDSPRSGFVVDRITSMFLESGYKVVSPSAADEALADGRVDFSLAISDVGFAEPVSQQAASRLLGGLTLRFKLYDIKGKTEIASVPVSVTSGVKSGSAQATEIEKQQLLQQLAGAAADDIRRQVNARLVSLKDRLVETPAAAGGTRSPQVYRLKLEGIEQRDRERIRTFREAVKKVVPGAVPEVDPRGTKGSRLEISFSAAEKFDPEDLVDELYAINSGNGAFDVRYEGNFEFAGGYKAPAKSDGQKEPAAKPKRR